MTNEVKTPKKAKAPKAEAAVAVKTAKVKAAAPAAKTAKAAPAAKAEKTAPVAKVAGRQANPETVELLGKIEKLASRKTGASNIEVAQELGVTTLKASALGRRLVDKGVLAMVKGDNGRVTYQKAA